MTVINEIFAQARKENRTVLTEIEAKKILAESGIPCTDTRLAKSKAEAVKISEAIGFPVVLKVSSVDITHKSDAGGVKVNLKDKAAVETAFEEIMASARAKFPNAVIEGVSVQKMANPGLEIIIGVSEDPNFGPVMMFGLGGVLVEILKDVSFRIIPIEKPDAVDMMGEIQGKKLLDGYRGQDPVDKACIEEMLLSLSDFVNKTPGIVEIDMNPVFAYKDGAVVVDARIILSAV